jgi:hypothetical protein
MKKQTLLAAGLIIALIYSTSCNYQGWRKDNHISENSIIQAADGTFSLKLENAACYSNELNPSSNTAEWSVVVSKPGRYKVWLSSATKDTMYLHYANSVKVTMLDNQLEVSPECDKIISNSGDVPYPYYRADSYMGSFFISEPGEYSIQVISEKVIPKEAQNQGKAQSENTMLMSLILAPMTR